MKTDFKELMSHGKNYVSAEFFSKGLAFLTIPIFTELLSPHEYGILSVYTSFVGTTVVLFGFGFRGAVDRYFHEKTNDFYIFLGSCFWFLTLGGFFLILIGFFISAQIILLFQIPLGMIYIGLCVAFFTTSYEIFQSYLIASRQSKKVSLFTILQSVLVISLSVGIMVYLKEERYYGRALAEFIGAFFMAVIAVFSLKKYLNTKPQKKHIKYSIAFGLPIIVHLLSQNILNTFDQVIINQLVDETATGLYSLAYKIGMIQSIVSMGILRAWTPILYSKMNEKRFEDINDLASKYGWIVCGVAMCLILFSKEVVYLMSEESYHESLPMVPIVIIGYLFFFLYTMYVGFAFYYKKTKLISVFTIIAGGLNIGLNYWLIPQYGYISAAWTTVASYICLFVLHYINVRWIIKSELVTRLSIFVLPFIMAIALAFLSNYFLTLPYSISLPLRVFIFVMVLSLYIFKLKPSWSE